MKKQLSQNKSVRCYAADGDLSLFFRFLPSGHEQSKDGDDNNLIQKLNKQVREDSHWLDASLLLTSQLNQLLIDLSGPIGDRDALAPSLGIDMQLLDADDHFHFEPLLFRSCT